MGFLGIFSGFHIRMSDIKWLHLFFSLDFSLTSFSASIQDVDVLESPSDSSFELKPDQSWWFIVTGFSATSCLLFKVEYATRSLVSATLLLSPIVAPRNPRLPFKLLAADMGDMGKGLGGDGGYCGVGPEVDIGVGPSPVQPAGRRLTGAASFSFYENSIIDLWLDIFVVSSILKLLASGICGLASRHTVVLLMVTTRVESTNKTTVWYWDNKVVSLQWP